MARTSRRKRTSKRSRGSRRSLRRNMPMVRRGSRVYIPTPQRARGGKTYAGMATVHEVLGQGASVYFDTMPDGAPAIWVSGDDIERVEIRNNRGRRTSRNPPPPLYRGVGVDMAGHKVNLGPAGPLSRVKDATMAAWLGDPSMRSAYVLDPRGHSYLSLEPRDRARLSANTQGQSLLGYRSLSEKPDGAVQINDLGDIVAAMPGSGEIRDWWVYEQQGNGRWQLIDTMRTLREVRQKYGHGYRSEVEENRISRNRGGERLDAMEHELEHELMTTWNALRDGDTWRAQDAFAYVEALEDFATPSQRTEIRSLRDALRHARITPWHSDGIKRNHGGGLLYANKLSELEVWQSVAAVRQHGHPTEMAGMLPPGVAAKFKRLPPGLYKYGYGPKKGEAIVQFKNASLLGAMTSTRIGASKVGETHWVIDNFDPKFPVIIRGINDHGQTYFRVEEYAKTLPSAAMHAVARRAKTRSAAR